MRGIAQQLDRLQMHVEQRIAGRISVDELRQRALRRHPPRLTRAAAEVAPMMRRLTTSEEVEAGFVAMTLHPPAVEPGRKQLHGEFIRTHRESPAPEPSAGRRRSPG